MRTVLLFLLALCLLPKVSIAAEFSNGTRTHEDEKFDQWDDAGDDDLIINRLDFPDPGNFSADGLHRAPIRGNSQRKDLAAENSSDGLTVEDLSDLFGFFDWEPRKTIRYFRYGSVTLVSRQPAILYREGEPLLEIKEHDGGYKYINNIKIYYGDLLAVESTKRKAGTYGVAVDVRLKVKGGKGRRTKYVHYKTEKHGTHRVWRGSGELQSDWTVEKSGFCSLPRTNVVKGGIVKRLRNADAPPLSRKTRYVWVSSAAGEHHVVPETAYLRLHVGIRCEKGRGHKRKAHVKLPRQGRIKQMGKTSRIRDDEAKREPNGLDQPNHKGNHKTIEQVEDNRVRIREEFDNYPVQCKCRVIPADENSMCYEMLIPGKSGRCKRRKCGHRYKCVAGDEDGLTECLRRISRYQTVLKSDYAGTLLCDTKKLEEPDVFYTLNH